jgi:hypothetical protein
MPSEQTLIRAIHSIEDAGPVVRISQDVDLDALLLEILGETLDNTDYEDAVWLEEDDPSRIPWGWNGPEATVGWFRMDPCPCYDREHGWHIRYLGEDRPEGKISRGSWFGVWFQ